MSDQTPGSAPAPLPLPDNPNLDWLRKQARRRLEDLRKANPAAKLAGAQFDLATSALNRRMSRNENNQLPLHVAVRMGRLAMVALLLELGADPLAVDGGGMPAAGYATAPDTDREVMERIRRIASAELVSAERGHRPPRGSMMDLVALLSLGDWETAAVFVHGNRGLVEKSGLDGGSLHLLAKRGDARAVKWLLDHGANPNARWSHWDAEVTPLHLAAAHGHADVVRLLLKAGADPRVRDSKHDGDAIGWAEFFRQPDIVQILEAHATNT